MNSHPEPSTDTSAPIADILPKPLLADEASAVTSKAGNLFGMMAVVLAGFVSPPIPLRDQEAELVTVSESVTSTDELKRTRLREALRRVFAIGVSEVFEDGMESAFSRQFRQFMTIHKLEALEVLERDLSLTRLNEEVASEALRWLGQMTDKETQAFRQWVMERGLRSPSARVRDGALLGLDFLGSATALPELRGALTREKDPELREDIRQVIEELEALGNGQNPS